MLTMLMFSFCNRKRHQSRSRWALSRCGALSPAPNRSRERAEGQVGSAGACSRAAVRRAIVHAGMSRAARRHVARRTVGVQAASGGDLQRQQLLLHGKDLRCVLRRVRCEPRCLQTMPRGIPCRVGCVCEGYRVARATMPGSIPRCAARTPCRHARHDTILHGCGRGRKGVGLGVLGV